MLLSGRTIKQTQRKNQVNTENHMMPKQYREEVLCIQCTCNWAPKTLDSIDPASKGIFFSDRWTWFLCDLQDQENLRSTLHMQDFMSSVQMKGTSQKSTIQINWSLGKSNSSTSITSGSRKFGEIQLIYKHHFWGQDTFFVLLSILCTQHPRLHMASFGLQKKVCLKEVCTPLCS